MDLFDYTTDQTKQLVPSDDIRSQFNNKLKIKLLTAGFVLASTAGIGFAQNLNQPIKTTYNAKTTQKIQENFAKLRPETERIKLEKEVYALSDDFEKQILSFSDYLQKLRIHTVCHTDDRKVEEYIYKVYGPASEQESAYQETILGKKLADCAKLKLRENYKYGEVTFENDNVLFKIGPSGLKISFKNLNKDSVYVSSMRERKKALLQKLDQGVFTPESIAPTKELIAEYKKSLQEAKRFSIDITDMKSGADTPTGSVPLETKILREKDEEFCAYIIGDYIGIPFKEMNYKIQVLKNDLNKNKDILEYQHRTFVADKKHLFDVEYNIERRSADGPLTVAGSKEELLRFIEYRTYGPKFE